MRFLPARGLAIFRRPAGGFAHGLGAGAARGSRWRSALCDGRPCRAALSRFSGRALQADNVPVRVKRGICATGLERLNGNDISAPKCGNLAARRCPEREFMLY